MALHGFKVCAISLCLQISRRARTPVTSHHGSYTVHEIHVCFCTF
jgi:hypothetical protein